MRWFSLLVLVVACHLNGTVAAASPAEAANSFIVLCYHETRDDVRDYPDPFAVDSAALVRQFAWLRGNGYTPVSLDAILAARRGGPALPAKAVLLTFDDAYLSFYTRVYPLLREFRFPAVLGVVGKWIDQPPGEAVLYGEKGTVADASFPTWAQLREMADSGLVELASHTYDLHRGVPANPQGNLQPAATARIYDAATGRYEDDAAWRVRVRADLARNSAAIERETGHRPSAVVWPYGSYNDELVSMAGELGMPVALTLDDGLNTPDVPLTSVRRILIEHNPSLAEFSLEVRGPRTPPPVRVVQVSLDDVFSADPALQERNLSVLLDRIEVLKPTHVWLQATADFDGDGIADHAYFPNRHLPLRGNLFNRAAWQLASRVDVKVYAVMPVTGFRLPPDAIAEVYADLARHANFDGLVFEDQSPPAGQPATPETAGTLARTRQLATRARAFRAPLKTVRTLPVAAGAVAWDWSGIAPGYDYVALRVLPASESAAAHAGFPAGTPVDSGTRNKAVFMLGNSRERADEGRALARQMRALQLGGILNFGYGPDDFLQDRPPLAEIAPVLSLRVYPLALKQKER